MSIYRVIAASLLCGFAYAADSAHQKEEVTEVTKVAAVKVSQSHRSHSTPPRPISPVQHSRYGTNSLPRHGSSVLAGLRPIDQLKPLDLAAVFLRFPD